MLIVLFDSFSCWAWPLGQWGHGRPLRLRRRYGVMQLEYLAVMGSNPSCFAGTPNLPVDTATWFDATAYCEARTQRERVADRIATISVYCLPTEAEWEYACRAGTSDRRSSYGDGPAQSSLTNYAWNLAKSGSGTHPVGQRLANLWGLYDMHGNVWEWCQDWHGSYPGGIAVDPQGPATSSNRVIYDGAWNFHARGCQSAYHGNSYPDAGSHVVRLRAVLASGDPGADRGAEPAIWAGRATGCRLDASLQRHPLVAMRSMNDRAGRK